MSKVTNYLVVPVTASQLGRAVPHSLSSEIWILTQWSLVTLFYFYNLMYLLSWLALHYTEVAEIPCIVLLDESTYCMTLYLFEKLFLVKQYIPKYINCTFALNNKMIAHVSAFGLRTRTFPAPRTHHLSSLHTRHML